MMKDIYIYIYIAFQAKQEPELISKALFEFFRISFITSEYQVQKNAMKFENCTITTAKYI